MFVAHTACHPTGHLIPTRISFHWACHPTEHLIPPGILSQRACHPTGHFIPPRISSHRTSYPNAHVIPPGISSYRTSHPTLHLIPMRMSSHRAFHPTAHLIPLGISFHWACHHTGHDILQGISSHRASHPIKQVIPTGISSLTELGDIHKGEIYMSHTHGATHTQRYIYKEHIYGVYTRSNVLYSRSDLHTERPTYGDIHTESYTRSDVHTEIYKLYKWRIYTEKPIFKDIYSGYIYIQSNVLKIYIGDIYTEYTHGHTHNNIYIKIYNAMHIKEISKKILI